MLNTLCLNIKKYHEKMMSFNEKNVQKKMEKVLI